MVCWRAQEDLAGANMAEADKAGADMAGARYQQARAASLRFMDGRSGSGVLHVKGSPVFSTRPLRRLRRAARWKTCGELLVCT